MEQKIVQIDFNAARARLLSRVRELGQSARGKAQSAAALVGDRARTTRNTVMNGLLAKGIQLSERQLKALQDARKSFS